MKTIVNIRFIAVAAVLASTQAFGCGILPLRTAGEIAASTPVPPVAMAGPGAVCGFLSGCARAPLPPIGDVAGSFESGATRLPGISYAFRAGLSSGACALHGGVCPGNGAFIGVETGPDRILRVASAGR